MQTPSEFVTSYALIGQKKAKSPATKLLVLGVLAGFLIGNLLPVTLGNIIGGCSFGALMWFAHGPEQAATPVTVRMVPHETVKKTAS